MRACCHLASPPARTPGLLGHLASPPARAQGLLGHLASPARQSTGPLGPPLPARPVGRWQPPSNELDLPKEQATLLFVQAVAGIGQRESEDKNPMPQAT
jgi:hypothetical protein